MGVGGQHFRSGVVLQHGAPPDRNTGVSFGDHRDVAGGGPDSDHRGLGVSQVRTTVGADAGHPELSQEDPSLLTGNAHHGAAGSVVAEGDHDGEVRDLAGAAHPCLHLRQSAHGLQPENVGPPGIQPGGLLGKGVRGVIGTQVTQRLEQLAGWAHGAGDQDQSIDLVGHPTSVGGRRGVQFVDPIL